MSRFGPSAPGAGAAQGMFVALALGAPDVTIAQVRRAYQEYAQYHYANPIPGVVPLWTTTWWEIARCHFLGIDPITGEPITDFEASLDKYARDYPKGYLMRKEYERFMNHSVLLRRLAEEHAADDGS